MAAVPKRTDPQDTWAVPADLAGLRKALSCAPDGPRLLEVDTTVTTTH